MDHGQRRSARAQVLPGSGPPLAKMHQASSINLNRWLWDWYVVQLCARAESPGCQMAAWCLRGLLGHNGDIDHFGHHPFRHDPVLPERPKELLGSAAIPFFERSKWLPRLTSVAPEPFTLCPVLPERSKRTLRSGGGMFFRDFPVPFPKARFLSLSIFWEPCFQGGSFLVNVCKKM